MTSERAQGTAASDTRERMTRKVAAIDLGTVSSRLALAEVAGAQVLRTEKRTQITDLGRGVDATGLFSEDAIERVVEACAGFAAEARAFGAECACTTLTSAARDACNAGILLERLRTLGLDPQVIPGEVEARLTFLGVARDFAGERIAVADSGGGSTEIVVGSFRSAAADAPGALELDRLASLDIGCRRVTDRFLAGDPPRGADILRAGRWAAEQFAAYWSDLSDRPDRLVAVGGTVTTLVALTQGLVPYDASFVHLHSLSALEVERAIDRMRKLPAAAIAELPGIQPKRAPVMLAGAVIIRELMRAGGYGELTVSENSLLAGAVSTMGEVLAGETPSAGWTPRLSHAW